MDVLAVILFFWARHLAKRAEAPGWLRRLPTALVIVFVGSWAATLLGLLHAFGSSDAIDVEHRARYLADRISFAMTFIAIGFGFEVLVLGVLVWATWLRARRA